MTTESATQPHQRDPFDVARAYRSAEVTWWRSATDNGRDTAFGRKLAAEKAGMTVEAVSR